MKVQKACLVNTQPGSPRTKEVAEVVGVVVVTPNDDGYPSTCFQVRYKDGTNEYVPIFAFPVTNKNSNYLLGAENVLSEKVNPEVAA